MWDWEQAVGAGVMAGLGSELGAFGNTVLVPGLLVSSCYVPVEHQEFGVRCSQVWSNEALE